MAVSIVIIAVVQLLLILQTIVIRS